jgi:hypothetical protein
MAMDATYRVADEFDRLVAMGQDKMPARPHPERVLYFVVATRCEIDMEGFESVYEQAFTLVELGILIDGLRLLGEADLAEEFARGIEVLRQEGFYDHLNWNRVSPIARRQINEIGQRIVDRLWGLDEKLIAMLEDQGTNDIST